MNCLSKDTKTIVASLLGDKKLTKLLFCANADDLRHKLITHAFTNYSIGDIVDYVNVEHIREVVELMYTLQNPDLSIDDIFAEEYSTIRGLPDICVIRAAELIYDRGLSKLTPENLSKLSQEDKKELIHMRFVRLFIGDELDEHLRKYYENGRLLSNHGYKKIVEYMCMEDVCYMIRKLNGSGN